MSEEADVYRRKTYLQLQYLAGEERFTVET